MLNNNNLCTRKNDYHLCRPSFSVQCVTERSLDLKVTAMARAEAPFKATATPTCRYPKPLITRQVVQKTLPSYLFNDYLLLARKETLF